LRLDDCLVKKWKTARAGGPACSRAARAGTLKA
jgi:hypothetical protein